MSKVTARQQQVKELFDELGTQSAVARHLGVSTITIRQKLIQFEYNSALDRGEVPSEIPLYKLKKGRISSMRGGRPSSVQLFGDLENVHVLLPHGPGPTSFIPQDQDLDPDEPQEPVFTSRIIVKPTRIEPPASGKKTVLFTSAQDATTLHQPFWDKWNRYAEDLDAEMVVGGFTYGKSLFEDHSTQGAYFASEVEQHMARGRLQVADAMDLCCEMNTLPTAVTPLSGLQAFTGSRWGIFPHAKHQLESIHRMPQDRYKANMTTGTCTLPNYIPKKSGIKAEALHTLGGVIVEILPDGRTWARHIAADPETGSFRDLDVLVDDNGISRGNRVEGLQYGDVHHEKLDPAVAMATWGYDSVAGRMDRRAVKASLFERLRPRFQFMHDLSDFAPRNHHNAEDPHFRFLTFLKRTNNVEHELRRCARFLELTRRDWCITKVIQSNHDNALEKWLKSKSYDYKTDEENALFYLEAQAYCYRYMKEHGRPAFIFEDVMRRLSRDKLRAIDFLSSNDSFKITRRQIETTQHGDLGAGGRPGSPASYRKIATSLNTGHTHAPTMIDNLATAGTCNLDMGYNKGLTNWGVGHLITHVDGARQLAFLEGDRFHA